MASDILVLDPDQVALEALARDLRSLGHRIFATPDSEQARAIAESRHPELLLCDARALSGRGSKLILVFRDVDADLPIVVLTTLDTVEAAAQAVRDGALFYLLRPFTPDNLRVAVERSFRRRQRDCEAPAFDRSPGQVNSAEVIVGASHALQRVLELAGTVARSDANILIFGESGTGKELFARVIHTCSLRSAGVFIPVDCASLPENLLEAELFGYEKGAFTGAAHTKPGLMELANRGTLFFDEIAELPMNLQPKLLRALQERRHRRLGGTRIVEFDVRVVSATNRDLRAQVAQRLFRQDLFYRLNVVPLHLPPLRMRDKDVVLLANHFLQQCSRKNLSAPKRFAPEVLGLFEHCPWPGNVRELQNVVEYSCAVARTETITLQDLPAELQMYDPQTIDEPPSLPAPTFKLAKARFEAGYVAELLKRHDNNVSQAAKAAGVDRKTFYALLQKHHISPRQ
ncbi:MAG TPA: sigma-54 dependent transcriptional regulator [Candidatus Binataceae bacterium]|nr:sigma-54 dependent transcriptional regulator [Candidatus Binataceae bacterium]